MGAEVNKRLIALFNSYFERSEIDAILDGMTDDATWWVNGRTDRFPGAGTRTKMQIGEAWRRMFSFLENPLQMSVENLAAEDDRVVAQVRARATTSADKVYNNGLLMLFTLRDGSIAEVREYADLLTATDVLG